MARSLFFFFFSRGRGGTEVPFCFFLPDSAEVLAFSLSCGGGGAVNQTAYCRWEN